MGEKKEKKITHQGWEKKNSYIEWKIKIFT